MRPIRIAILGQGVGRRLHLPIFSQQGATVHFLHSPVLCSSLSNHTDLIIVATPPFRQLQDAMICAEITRTTPILVEKPAGISSRELATFVDNLGDEASRTRVNYQLRYHPAMEALRRELALTSREIALAHVHYRSASGLIRPVPAWYRDPQLGGGVKFAVGTHVIDLLLELGMLSADCDVVSSMSTTSKLHACLTTQADAGRIRETTIDIDTDVDYASFVLSLLKRDGSEISVDLILHSVIRNTRSTPLPRPSHPANCLTSRWTSPWREAYTVFAQEFALVRRFDSRSAMLADAYAVHKILEKVATFDP